MEAKKALELAATGQGIIHLGAPEIAKILLFMRELVQISSQHASARLSAGDREGALLFAHIAVAGEQLPGCQGLAPEAYSLYRQLRENPPFQEAPTPAANKIT